MNFKQLLAEFKAFAFKGNMIDLAVAVVIGAAFSQVINSLVKDVIMPTISYATSAATTAVKATEEAATKATAAVGLTTQPATQPTTEPTTEAATQPSAPTAAAPPPPAPTPAAAPAEKPPEKPVDIDWKIGRIEIGKFIAEILNFIIVAFAVFILLVKLLGSVMKRAGGTPVASEPTTKECPECLSVIPIKARRCALHRAIARSDCADDELIAQRL